MAIWLLTNSIFSICEGIICKVNVLSSEIHPNGDDWSSLWQDYVETVTILFSDLDKYTVLTKEITPKGVIQNTFAQT